MTDLERLLAVEEIKQLKARYFYYLDRRDWDAWRREVWAPDASLHVPTVREEPYRGVDTIVAWVAERAVNQHSTHQGHMPIIEILSDTTAKAVWPMEDIIRLTPEMHSVRGYTYLHGWGHYHETYVKLEKGWRIQSSRLDRHFVEQS